MGRIALVQQMGFFLSSIKEDLPSLALKIPAHSHPFAKVREYHGIFKSVCNDFLINPQQFQQIFEGGEEELSMWSNNKLVNALELFSGLAFYAEGCSFRLKLRFLFSLFDFNEIKSISIVDLEYMLLSICDFTYKVLGKINTRTDQLRLADWLSHRLDQRKRVTVTQLYRLCAQAKQLRQFLAVAGATPQELDRVDREHEALRVVLQEPQEGKERQLQVATKLNWFNLLCGKLVKPKYKRQTVSNTRLNWVYGIEIDKVRRPLLAMEGPVLLYAVSNKMVVLNEPENQQLIYTRHTREVTAFSLRPDDHLVASAEGTRHPHVYLWRYDSLQTVHILRLDHSHRVSCLGFAQHQPLLAVVGERADPPILLFQTITWNLRTSLRLQQPVTLLVPFSSYLPHDLTPSSLQGCFVLSGGCSVAVVDEAGLQQSVRYESEVTALAVSYMNNEFPHLRFFSGDNLRLFVLTGHANGAVVVWQLNSEDEPEGLNEKVEILRMDEPICELYLAPESLLIAHGQEIKVYDLSVVTSRGEQVESEEVRCVRLGDIDQLRLLTTNIRAFTVTAREMCVITTEGELVVIGDREVVLDDAQFRQKEAVRRVSSIIKFSPNMQALCFLQRQLHNVLLVVSEGRRIIQIDTQTHQTDLVLEIGMDDYVTVIDSAVSEDGIGITVCGCKSGKLVLRSDWEEVGKVVDCASEVCDLKISPQGSALLVATTNTLVFFHLGPTLSSPRKLTFENEIPLSLAFLDNSKFCAVATSAKNVYIIELPALKHKSVFKEVDSFAASRLPIAFPKQGDRPGPPSLCMVGGDMKFYLIGLSNGELLFFPSMSSLQDRKYLLLGGHCCHVANLAVTDDQQYFYSLGGTDGMLLEWKVQEQESLSHPPINSTKICNFGKPNWFIQFQNILSFSETATQTSDFSLSTFFLRGTKSKKLNHRLKLQLKLALESQTTQELALAKRHCNFSLEAGSVYGLDLDKPNQVRYRYRNPEDGTLLYAASRFLVELAEGTQRVNELGARRVSFIDVEEQGEVIWAEAGRLPWVWRGGERCVQTTHTRGLLLFSLQHDFLLSYGLSDGTYTLNLHNYRTGQLLAQRTTNAQITHIFFLSEQQFVSIPDVCHWTDLVASPHMGLATAGAILRNGKDICLGGINGQLSVMGQNGLVEVAHQAHSKQITAMRANIRQGRPELVTASLDETLKIWNQYFEQLLLINLNLAGQFTMLAESDGDIHKTPNICVRSLDCKGNLILIGFAHGQVWEYSVTTQLQKMAEGDVAVSELSIASEESEAERQKSKFVPTERTKLTFKVASRKLLDAHASGLPISERYLIFDVHPKLALLATAGNDGRLILIDYERGEVVGNYLCDSKKRVRTVKFSPRGRMMVVGLSGGVIITFFLNYASEELNSQQFSLDYFQTFKPDFQAEILEIEFDKEGEFFAASYWIEGKRFEGNERPRSGNVRVFKVKSEKNHNADEAFYEARETIQLREDEKSSSGTTKCVVRMNWVDAHEKHYLILYCENLEHPQKRTHKGKYDTYCLEEKGYLSDEFGIDWAAANFPNLLNIRAVGSDAQPTTEDYQLTTMHTWDNVILCGGIDGCVHLVRRAALCSEEDAKEEDMCLSRVYNSHSSYLTRILTAVGPRTGKRYVFTAAFGDQTLVQFQLVQQDPSLCLSHSAYPMELPDEQLHGECKRKEEFYLLLNNRQPLREELAAVLQDVEPSQPPEVALTPQRIFGRRANDRRYNLAFFQQHALYSVGPNIVIQALRNPEAQQLLHPDPQRYSHCPQVSTFHYEGRWLGVTTEEERSRLYVWDICSRSCVSTLELECVSVLKLRFSGQSLAILLGFNQRYELLILLVDWRQRKTVGRSRLAHSGNWVIRDLSTVSIKGNGREFVTCGYLHLCYWQLRGDRLVYSSFNSQTQGRYLSVCSLNDYILTGCESGKIYLWLNFELVHVLHDAHQAAVRCLEADHANDIIISGGKDGLILFLKIQEHRLSIFNRAKIRQAEDQDEEQGWKVEEQVQAIALSPQQLSDDWEKVLVGTRSGAIYQVKFNDHEENTQIELLFEGHDHQAIVGAAFSIADPNCFYTLSNAGRIDCWDLLTLTKRFPFDLGRRALKLQAWGQHLLVCCRNEVVVYKMEAEGLTREEEFCIDTRRGEESQSLESKESEILRMCLSLNGQTLAVCIKICSKEPIYQISLYEFGKGKEPVHTLNNLKHEIDYLDFSKDDQFLLFKDRYEEIGMLALTPDKDYKRINTIFVEMNIEWQQEGLRISPHAQKIYYSYSCENKITAITRLGNDKIIVGDQMGTVRIFAYPCPDDRLGELHLQCYANHMNDINIVKVHPDLTHVITTALMDRSLILWKIVQPQKL